MTHPYQLAMQARYDAAHAAIMASEWAELQTDIDSGEIWTMDDGPQALAMKLLIVGAVMAPATETTHPKGADGPTRIPTVWDLDGDNGRGSIQQAEAYIYNENAKK